VQVPPPQGAVQVLQEPTQSTGGGHDALETEHCPPQAQVPVLVCPQDVGIVALQVFESTPPLQVPQTSTTPEPVQSCEELDGGSVPGSHVPPQEPPLQVTVRVQF